MSRLTRAPGESRLDDFTAPACPNCGGPRIWNRVRRGNSSRLVAVHESATDAVDCAADRGVLL